mmetsp:Transcript_11737/g.33140  ORF Transcript_11737/g.33140 Transcript_11737/m.33140 type:complete len:329 (-) Transcript_11737:978-1964(-)
MCPPDLACPCPEWAKMRTPRRRWHKTRDAFVTFVTLWSDICKHIDDLRLALVLFVGLNDGEYRRLVWVEEVDEVDAPVQALGHVGLVGVLVPTDRRHEHALVDVKGELQVARPRVGDELGGAEALCRDGPAVFADALFVVLEQLPVQVRRGLPVQAPLNPRIQVSLAIFNAVSLRPGMMAVESVHGKLLPHAGRVTGVCQERWVLEDEFVEFLVTEWGEHLFVEGGLDVVDGLDAIRHTRVRYRSVKLTAPVQKQAVLVEELRMRQLCLDDHSKVVVECTLLKASAGQIGRRAAQAERICFVLRPGEGRARRRRRRTDRIRLERCTLN